MRALAANDGDLIYEQLPVVIDEPEVFLPLPLNISFVEGPFRSELKRVGNRMEIHLHLPLFEAAFEKYLFPGLLLVKCPAFVAQEIYKSLQLGVRNNFLIALNRIVLLSDGNCPEFVDDLEFLFSDNPLEFVKVSSHLKLAEPLPRRVHRHLSIPTRHKLGHQEHFLIYKCTHFNQFFVGSKIHLIGKQFVGLLGVRRNQDPVY